jgi:small subunit ribosomal protein S13
MNEEEIKNKEKKVVDEVRLIRILGKDIRGDKKLFVGITNLKGISWSFANALCKVLKLDPNKKIAELSEKEIQQITEFVKSPKIPSYLMNRRKDYNFGGDKHIVGSDLDMQKDFDIKRIKKIKSYKGVRHIQGQPVRGQRTKSHFRTNRKNKKGGTKVVKGGSK